MKKIILLVVSLFCFTSFSQKTKILPAKRVDVSYPTSGQEFITRLQSDVRNNTLPVYGSNASYFAWGGEMHGISAEEYKQELLGNLVIIEVESSEIDNSAWNPEKRKHELCGTRRKKIKVYQNVDSGTILGKVNCLNVCRRRSKNTLQSMDEFTLGDSLPPTGEMLPTITNNHVGTTPQVIVVQTTTPTMSSYVSSPSTLIGINPVPQMQLPMMYVNNTYWNGPTRGVVQPNPPTSSCPPGQYLYTYPDGSTQCLSYNTSGVGTNPSTSNGNTSGIGTNPGTGDGSNDSTPPGNSSGNGTDPGARIRRI